MVQNINTSIPKWSHEILVSGSEPPPLPAAQGEYFSGHTMDFLTSVLASYLTFACQVDLVFVAPKVIIHLTLTSYLWSSRLSVSIGAPQLNPIKVYCSIIPK